MRARWQGLLILGAGLVGLAIGYVAFLPVAPAQHAMSPAQQALAPVRQAVSEVSAAVERRTAESVFGSRRLNLLVLGYQEDEGNSDTIILAHLDIDRHTATLVSIPRDAWVTIPGHGRGKINAAIGLGGPSLTAAVVERLMGVPIDATIAIRPEGAKQLVDAIGGLNVNVERTMDYDDNAGNLHIHLKKGEQYLTGGQVLGYMRFRHDVEADWGRMRRQQQVLRAIVTQMAQPAQWFKMPRLLALARQDVTTPLSDAQLAALIEIYKGLNQDDLRTLTVPGRPATVGDASVVLVDPQWAHLLGKIVFAKDEPPQDALVVANATGIPGVDKTIAGALRGSGWNVRTFYDQPPRPRSEIVGSSRAAVSLSRIFTTAGRRAGRPTMLRLGVDLAPDQG